MRSNEPLLIQALEEAILYHQALLEGELGSVAGFEDEDLKCIREYRKLLRHARGRVVRRRSGNTHPRKVR